MALDLDTLVRDALTTHVPDTDLRELARHAVGAVRLAFDRALAHDQDAQRFPLPTDPASLERAFAARCSQLPPAQRRAAATAAIARLEAAASARAQTYGVAAAIGLRQATSVEAALERLVIPPAVQTLADRARTKLAPLATLPASRAGGVGITPETPTGRLVGGLTGNGIGGGLIGGGLVLPGTDLTPRPMVPRTLRLGLRSVRCLEDSAELGRDEITFAAIAHDVLGRRQTTCGPLPIGQFKAGDPPQRFDPPRRLHDFPLLEGAAIEQWFPVTVFLAEADFGGFPTYVADNGAFAGPELFELSVLLGLGALSGVLGGFDAYKDARALTGAARTEAILALVLGLLGRLPTVVAGLLLALCVAVVLVIVEGLLALVRDEILSPSAVLQTVLPDGTLLGTGSRQIDQIVPFARKKARYEAVLTWEVLMGPSTGRVEVVPTAPPTAAQDDATALANLDKIDHLVVLMLENRSFDHMLGYLSLDRGRVVDGLRPDHANPLQGQDPFRVFPLLDTQFLHDPPHHVAAVARQINGGAMDGFVQEYQRVDPAHPGLVMGYHPAAHVPAFDLLATEFGVCDQWFASFAGNTWVNRTLALTGKAARRLTGEPITNNDPPFNAPSFFRLLDQRGVSWRFYSQDAPSLKMIDMDANEVAPARFASMQRFFQDAAADALPAVSYLDPNFIDFGPLQDLETHDFTSFLTTANDDHPPVDITHGQVLVSAIFLALFNSPAWRKTLFVCVYDEHGGFFDHVPPPPLPAGVAEGPEFQTLGVRVPALVISPWVGRGLIATRDVSRTRVFDHTSLIKTIFRRFCRTDGSEVGPRVAQAEHLGALLNEAAPRFVDPQPRAAVSIPSSVATSAIRAALSAQLLTGLGPRLAKAMVRKPLAPTRTDLQQQIEAARRVLADHQRLPHHVRQRLRQRVLAGEPLRG